MALIIDFFSGKCFNEVKLYMLWKLILCDRHQKYTDVFLVVMNVFINTNTFRKIYKIIYKMDIYF